MAKHRAVVTIGTLGLERASQVPLYRQLYDGLREAILSGRLRPGVRLPSTRALAKGLGASRNTVLAAFGQLLTEGYLEGRVGAGTTVARTLPETFLRARPEAAGARRPGRRPRLSRRGTLLVGTRGGLAGGAITARPFRRAPGARRLPVRPVDAAGRPAVAARPATAPRLRGSGRLRAAPRGDRGLSRRGAGRALRGVAGDRRDGRAAGGRSRRAGPPRSRGHRLSRTRATRALAAPWSRRGSAWRRFRSTGKASSGVGSCWATLPTRRGRSTRRARVSPWRSASTFRGEATFSPEARTVRGCSREAPGLRAGRPPRRGTL